MKLKKDNTQKIILIAMFSAIFAVLDRYVAFEVVNYKITLSAIPIIIMSLYYGSIEGLLVGLFGGLISQMLGYGLTITTPLWILPAVIRGLFCGFAKDKDLKTQVLIILSSSVIVSILNTGAMITDATIFGYNTKALELVSLITRFSSGILCGIIYCILIPPIVKRLNNIYNLSRC